MVSLTFLVTTALMAASGAELVDKALRSEEFAKAHRYAYLLEREVADKAPLQVLDGQLLVKPASGLGIYEKAPKNRIAGEEIYIYAQIRNHKSQRSTLGYQLHLVSDLVVFDQSGNRLAADQGFGESRFIASVEHRDTFINIALKSKGLPAGAYVFRLVVHDKVGSKSGFVDIQVVKP